MSQPSDIASPATYSIGGGGVCKFCFDGRVTMLASPAWRGGWCSWQCFKLDCHPVPLEAV